MQLTAVLVDQLALDYGLAITNTQILSGGDINEAYRVETSTGSFFLKYNQYPHGYDMLQTEALGLQQHLFGSSYVQAVRGVIKRYS